MRPLALALASVAIGVAAAAQSPDREPLATISHETIERGIVSEVAWDGGTLLIQTVAMRPTGELAPRYFASPAPGMALKHLPVAPPALEDYWKNKSSRISPTGEVWAWSPARLNRIAYVDGGGDLWIARTDGTGAELTARGDFTLPAWSDDGRLLAVAERKNGGRQWEISVLHVPARHRS